MSEFNTAASRRFVVLEAPDNESYRSEAIRDSIERGEVPLPSATYYESFYDNDSTAGIEASMAMGSIAAATVVYIDRGVTPSMKTGLERAHLEGRSIEEREINKTKPYGAWE